MQQSLVAGRMTAPSREGNKPDDHNIEFNNWLIPGVGMAPVGVFQCLITLFVLAIGPLNYWWLKRQKKLPLLLVTVPACAALVTLLLLIYGTVADGIGVRVRARSLTMLDQRKGEAATWARLTYYAGINPREGLSLPGDTVIAPIRSRWASGQRYRGPTVAREMVWDERQRLTRGWLPSRTSTQYLTINARATSKRLDMRADDDGLRIINHLGVGVTHLIVQDHAGKLYWRAGFARG